MKKLLSTFAADESGVTAVEYGALACFIGVALMLVVEAIGSSLQGTLLEIKVALIGSSLAQR